MIFILAGLFALAGLYNLYLFGQVRERAKFTKTDLAVFLMMVLMYALYYWVFKPYIINLLAIALSMIFWRYTSSIARGFSENYVFTNQLNPFINKKILLGEIKSITLSRAEKNLLLIVYFKTANSEDKMRFDFNKEKYLIRLLKREKINIIN